MSSRLILCAVLLTAVLGWHFNNPFADSHRADPTETYASQQLQYFDQVLDHFSYLPAKLWKQRYYVNDAHFNQNNGAVFLVICGEGPCTGVADQSWISTLAEKEQALIISLEHRYYGESLPFRAASFDLNNLKYLNSKQALKDIAFFIESVKRNKWYGVS